MKKHLCVERGFTVIEILVMIAVISTLATVSFVAYNGIQDRARLATARAQLDSLAKAMDLYRTTKWVNATTDAEMKEVLTSAGLYDATRDFDKLSFGICAKADGYAFVAWRPIVKTAKNGDTLYLYSQANTQTTHVLTNSSLTSGHVDRLCDQVLPGATYERWSDDIS